MKQTAADKKKLKELQAELKRLQAALVDAKKVEGVDDYIDVKVLKSQARSKRVRRKGEEDRATGNYFMEVRITAKEAAVFVPLSIATGKKTAGFMYHIEGGAAASVIETDLKAQGEGISTVTVGTLLFAKVPGRKSASFRIQIGLQGSFGKTYKVAISRINYKLDLADHRYRQYLKELHSDSVKFT